MKKLLLITAMAVFGFTHVHAQEFHLGAKVGINFSDVYGEHVGDLEPITSIINFGVVGELALTEKFSFQPELMYSIQGYSVEDDIVSLNYLNLPLMGKYYLTKGFSLEAGPQIGFLLSAKREDINVKDNFKAVDFGVNFGLGYKLNNGLNFGVRYNLGLSNINNIQGSSSTLRNGVVQASIGYFFF